MNEEQDLNYDEDKAIKFVQNFLPLRETVSKNYLADWKQSIIFACNLAMQCIIARKNFYEDDSQDVIQVVPVWDIA